MLGDNEYLKRLDRIVNDPWYFCVNCVKTLDQADKVNPIKPFPKDRMDLKIYTRTWERERFIAVPKSRRMFMSWMNLILYTWDTAFHIGRLNGFCSKKEDDSDELVKRAKFVLDNIDHTFLPKDLIPKYDVTFCNMKLTELNSAIVGLAQGADQARLYTFSGLMLDEAAFMDKAQETYSAAFPTLEGGGRMTVVSSPGPGFFKRLVHDQFETASDS